MTLTAAIDDSGLLFVDGQMVMKLRYHIPQSATVNRNIQVIALDLLNYVGESGFILRSSTGIVSDSTWRCISNAPPARWSQADFDDSHWPNAVETWSNEKDLIGIKLSKFQPMDKWIRSQQLPGPLKHAYCRKKF